MSFARRLRNALLIIVALTIVGAALILVPLWAGPSLPAGATRLHIETGEPGPAFGCSAALLSPVRVATSGDELVLVSVETGNPIPVRWPGGHAAWRIDGSAVVADPYGRIVAREGQVRDDLGGGGGVDDRFNICGLGLTDRP